MVLGPVLAPEKGLVTLFINYLYLDQVLGLFSFCFLPSAPTLPMRGVTEQLGGHPMSSQGPPSLVLFGTQHGTWRTAALYPVCYCYSSGNLLWESGCWLHCLSLYKAEAGTVLVQTMALGFVLAWMALLCCGSCLVSTSPSPHPGLMWMIVQVPEVLVHVYMSC